MLKARGLSIGDEQQAERTLGFVWFTNMSICNDEHLFLENLNAVDREVRRSKEDYIKEHFSKYKDSAFPPAWKAMELLSD